MKALFFWTGAFIWFCITAYIFWALYYIFIKTAKDIITLSKIAYRTCSRIELVKYWLMLWFSFICLFWEQMKAYHYGYEFGIEPTEPLPGTKAEKTPAATSRGQHKPDRAE